MRISSINYPITNYYSNQVLKSVPNCSDNREQLQYSCIPYYRISPNINFKSLQWDKIQEYTNEMKKGVYSKRKIMELAATYKDSDGITIGRGIPDIWLNRIDNIKNFDKDNFITEYGKIFAKEREYSDIDVLEENLYNLFIKHKIIDKDTPFTVKYIGKGFQARAYNIIIGDDQDKGIVTKLFKNTYTYLQNHGNHTEQNLAEYVKNYSNDKSEFVKYYYGDTKNGIMLVDYLSPNVEENDLILDMKNIGIGYDDDCPRNKVNGHIIDYGGIITVNNLRGRKIAQQVHAKIKYEQDPKERMRIFHEILNSEQDEFYYEKMVGLTHSVKHLPKEEQLNLFNKLYELNDVNVNVALIQNIKRFSNFTGSEELIEKLVSTNVPKEQITIAKEIAHIPDKIRHQIFEEYADTKNQTIIKYLARNINHYYKNLENRNEIYSKFVNNCEMYAGIALINSLRVMSKSTYDEYFEKFYAMDNPIINTTLARNLELFEENLPAQKKWINKLLACDDVSVTTALCESVPFVDEELRKSLFNVLLQTEDNNAKEFLAENITSVPGYQYYPEWIDELLYNADNSVRRALAITIKSIKNPKIQKTWTEKVLQNADSSVADLLK